MGLRGLEESADGRRDQPAHVDELLVLREAAVDLVHDATGAAQRLDAFQHRVLHRRNDVGNACAPIHGDAPSRKVAVLGGIVEARPDRGHDLVGGADDRVLEMDEVVEASRHRARGRVGDFPARDPPERRPEAVDAVLRGGKADRAAHVRPQGERREARGQRRARSRGRPARGVFEVPRIAGGAPGAGRGADEEVEFRHRRLDRHDGAGRLERVDDGRVFRRARRVLVDERALRDPPARPGEFVLDGDRDSFERPRVAAPIAVLGLLGVLQRLVEVLVGDAVDLGVERLDPLDLRLQEIDRRSLLRLEHGDEIVDGSVAERIVGLGPRGRSIERRRDDRRARALDECPSINHVRLRAVMGSVRAP